MACVARPQARTQASSKRPHEPGEKPRASRENPGRAKKTAGTDADTPGLREIANGRALAAGRPIRGGTKR